MSASANIMSSKRFTARPANTVTDLFKAFFVKLYVALDKTQRERAAKIIQQYGYLISNRDENPGEAKKPFVSTQAGYESRQFWPVISGNRKRRSSKP